MNEMMRKNVSLLSHDIHKSNVVMQVIHPMSMVHKFVHSFCNHAIYNLIHQLCLKGL